MSDEIKPCPFCQTPCDDRSLVRCTVTLVATAKVICFFCHSSGPDKATSADAIAAWNAAPRPGELTGDGTGQALPAGEIRICCTCLYYRRKSDDPNCGECTRPVRYSHQENYAAGDVAYCEANFACAGWKLEWRKRPITGQEAQP